MLIADVVQMVYKCFVFSGYCGLVVCDAGPALTQRLEGPGCEERGHREVGYNQRLAGPGCEERGHREVGYNQRLACPRCEERGTGGLGK